MSHHHIIIKALNIHNREIILRAVKEKGQAPYKGQFKIVTHDFSMETMKVRRSWSSVM